MQELPYWKFSFVTDNMQLVTKSCFYIKYCNYLLHFDMNAENVKSTDIIENIVYFLIYIADM